jgi:hypothetical protein
MLAEMAQIPPPEGGSGGSGGGVVGGAGYVGGGGARRRRGVESGQGWGWVVAAAAEMAVPARVAVARWGRWRRWRNFDIEADSRLWHIEILDLINLPKYDAGVRVGVIKDISEEVV